jgi:hypothetical protein
MGYVRAPMGLGGSGSGKRCCDRVFALDRRRGRRAGLGVRTSRGRIREGESSRMVRSTRCLPPFVHVSAESPASAHIRRHERRTMLGSHLLSVCVPEWQTIFHAAEVLCVFTMLCKDR